MTTKKKNKVCWFSMYMSMQSWLAPPNNKRDASGYSNQYSQASKNTSENDSESNNDMKERSSNKLMTWRRPSQLMLRYTLRRKFQLRLMKMKPLSTWKAVSFKEDDHDTQLLQDFIVLTTCVLRKRNLQFLRLSKARLDHFKCLYRVSLLLDVL